MYFSIDRKIGQRAMLTGEDRKPLEVPLEMLPPGAKEGDMLLYEGGKFYPAPGKADERRRQVGEALAMLLRQGGNSDDDGDE
ncbi:DUF3006 domain-containing protein [Ruminococcaceae bacterium OttesenSCG-928-D13]|nr:DUF3006 domain-containing protein [Ruminococcaceae bacterium OttesenSCG-928-D13]